MTSMSCRLEPAIWSHDTGQQIPYFDRCQLIITWMSDIKEVHGKPRLHVSVNLLLEYGRHVARLHRRRRRLRRRAYAPTINAPSHGTHEKIISWVPFSSLIWVWGSAWGPSAAGAPLLTEPANSQVELGMRRKLRNTFLRFERFNCCRTASLQKAVLDLLRYFASIPHRQNTSRTHISQVEADWLFLQALTMYCLP